MDGADILDIHNANVLHIDSNVVAKDTNQLSTSVFIVISPNASFVTRKDIVFGRARMSSRGSNKNYLCVPSDQNTRSNTKS